VLSMTPRSGGPEALPYSPESDLRHCGFGMVCQVLKTFATAVDESGEPSPWLVEATALAGGTVDDLGRACQAFAEAFAAAIKDPDLTIADALEASGFLAMPEGIRELIAAQLGRQAIGMALYAIRDATPLGSGGHEASIARLVEGGAVVASALRARP
jgi:hypothetical protein